MLKISADKALSADIFFILFQIMVRMSTGIKSSGVFTSLPLIMTVWTVLVSILASCLGNGPDIRFRRRPLMEELPSSHTGIQFVNRLHESDTNNPLFYEYYYNGAGVAVGDINNI